MIGAALEFATGLAAKTIPWAAKQTGKWIWKGGKKVWKYDPINRYGFSSPKKVYDPSHVDNWAWRNSTDPATGMGSTNPTMRRRALGFAAPVAGLITAEEGIGLAGSQGKGVAKFIKGAEGDPETWRNAADQIREKYVWRH